MGRGVICYLHGFTSGPQSTKARLLQQRLAGIGCADCLDLPQLPPSPAEAMELADQLLDRRLAAGQRPTLIGSSLGGFYAAALAQQRGLAAVLVNPVVLTAIQPQQFIGRHRMAFSDGEFTFSAAHAEELQVIDAAAPNTPSPCWLLLERGDATLDYRHALRRHGAARRSVFDGGDHSFTRWPAMLDAIIGWCGVVAAPPA